MESAKPENHQHSLVRLIHDAYFSAASNTIELACRSFLKVLSGDPLRAEKARRMAGRLRSEQYGPALTELFEIWRLLPYAARVVSEPNHPGPGPDLLIEVGDTRFFEEVATIIGVKEQLDLDIEISEFVSRLRRAPTGRAINVEYVSKLGVTDSIRTVRKVIGQLLDGVFPEDRETIIHVESPSSVRVMATEREARRERPKIRLWIGPVRGEKTRTRVFTMYPLYLDRSQDSLRRVLSDKVAQLPPGQANVVLVDAPAVFSSADLLDVLYGQAKIEIADVAAATNSTRWVREGPRLVDKTSRLSGVLLQHSGIEMDGTYHFRREIHAISSAKTPLPGAVLGLLTVGHRSG